MANRFYIPVAVLACCLLTACSSVSYYSQSVFGHLGLMMQREDIPDLLQREATPEALKQKLQFVMQARRFASEDLHLPDNGSYTSYVDTQQPYVVWNVVAAPVLSLQLQKWCFLFAGCISYKGYYSEQDALAYAQELEQQGLDVYVRGATAYSTLGWFDDPVLNTFINYPEPNLAGIIFHELAHQILYVKDDSAFNESFATLVEREGVRRWLASRDSDPELLQQYRKSKQRRAEFNRMIVESNTRLRQIYASDQSDAVKLEKKRRHIERLRREYEDIKKRWGGYSGYDAWMAKPLNNAQLGSVSTYQDLVPVFQVLLDQQQGDLTAFFKAARELGELDAEQRNAKMASLRLLAGKP